MPLFISLATLLAPIAGIDAHARTVSLKSGVWVNISPSRVSVNPANFHGANFGFQAVAVDPKSGAVYVGTCYQGIWKSTNEGKSWAKVNTGTNGASLDSGRVWALTIDPVNPRVLYATAGYGAGGIFKSTDGGVDWTNTIPVDSPVEKSLQSQDVYSIALDPKNHNHILASFHGSFGNNAYASKAPILQSLDGGNTWTISSLPAASYPQYVYFLGNSSTWLVGTTGKGFWRTVDSGRHWAQVSTEGFTDGGSEIYHARNSGWYVAAFGNILHSANGGRTWQAAGPPVDAPYMGIVGDGTHLYTQPAVTGNRSDRQAYYVAPESNGTRWRQFGSQTFSDGPMRMAYDPIHHVVYSSNWRAGVWKLQVRRPARRSGSKPRLILTLKGHGSRTTKRFEVPQRWVLTWAFQSAKSSSPQAFRVVVQRRSGKVSGLPAIKWDGVSGHGSKSYHASGRFSLHVLTGGTWLVEIRAQS